MLSSATGPMSACTTQMYASGRFRAPPTSLPRTQDDIIQKARVSHDQGFTVTAALADQAAVDLSKVWPALCS